MTTGDPLVVRGAMKPLPTLTKPLRSVDIETKEPAQALRERTDSCTVPAAGVVGEAMVALELAARLPREVRRRPHATTRSRRCDAYERADRVEALEPPSRRRTPCALVLVGFMGAGKSSAARALAAELGVRAARRRPRARARARRADRGVLRPRGRGRVPRARGGGRAASCSRADARRVIALGGGAVGVRARARGAARAHASSTSRSTPRRLAARVRHAARPLARDRGRFEQLHARAPRRCTSRSPTPSMPPARPRRVPRGRCPRSRALRRGAARARGCLGRARRRATTRSSSAAGCCARGLLSARGRAPLRGHRRATWPRRHRSQGERPRSRSPPGEARQDARRAPSGCCARWRAAGMRARRHVVARRRRRRGRPRRLLRGHLPARHRAACRCPTTLVAQVDSAYGGKTGVDLPEGKNYVGRLPPAGGRARRPGALATLPAEELRGRLRRGGQDRADRRRPAVGARARTGGDAATTTIDPRLPAHEARGGGRGRARRRPPPGAQPRPHGRPRDRVGDRLRALPPRRGGRPRACWPRCGCRAARRCAPRCAELLAARGLPLQLRRRRRRRGGRRSSSATRSARGGAGAVRAAARRPARSRPGTRSTPDGAARGDRGAARGVKRNRVEVLHGVNLDMLGKRDPGASTAAVTLIELEVRDPALRARARARDELLADQPRGRVLRAAAPGAGDRRRAGAQPRRLDALLLRDPRRARDRRAAGGRGAPLGRRRARGVAPPLGDPRPLRRARAGQGRGRLP